MSKISLNELVNAKLSDKLIGAVNSIKGGNESECHPDDTTIPSSITIDGGNS